MKYYPIQIDVANKPCLIVGGGPIGLVKAKQLVSCGATLHLVSRSFVPGFNKSEAAVQHRRPFEDADVHGMYLVHAATNDPAMNEHIARCCNENEILCCVATESNVGSFSVPAQMEVGDLRVTIATNGASPSYGARLRREWTDRLPDFLQEYLDFLRLARQQSKEVIADPALRMRVNAYLASSEAEEEFVRLSLEERITWVEGLLKDPEQVPESYTPKWERT